MSQKHPDKKEIARQLLASKHDLVEALTELHLSEHPEWEARYGDEGRQKCSEDAAYHMEYLAEAIKYESPEMFNHYLDWTWNLLSARNIPKEDLKINIRYLSQVVNQHFSNHETLVSEVNDFIDAGIKSLDQVKDHQHTWLKPANPLFNEAQMYLNHLLKGNRREAADLVNSLVENGQSISDIYEHIFQATQYEVGMLWQKNEITVAHEHYCTAATQLIMSGLYPKIFNGNKKGANMVACTVVDELHEIGIRMVSDLFEMDGWDTYYLGSNLPIDHLMKLLREYNADLLALSVTLPIHVGRLEKMISIIRDQQEFKNLKIMAGGYPFVVMPQLAVRIGADATASNAREAIKTANQLINYSS